MRNYYIIIASALLFVACNQQVPEQGKTKTQGDTVATLPPEEKFKKEFNRYVKVIKERDLKTDTATANEFRFFFFQPRWLGEFEFYKVSYKDSSLTCKDFRLKLPDGCGSERLLNSRTIKLTKNDFDTITWLIDKSMFWGLETITDDVSYLDAKDYIYEGRRDKEDKFYPDLKKYHVVKRYAPHNSDFINLGQWLRKKGKNESEHKKK